MVWTGPMATPCNMVWTMMCRPACFHIHYGSLLLHASVQYSASAALLHATLLHTTFLHITLLQYCTSTGCCLMPQCNAGTAFLHNWGCVPTATAVTFQTMNADASTCHPFGGHVGRLIQTIQLDVLCCLRHLLHECTDCDTNQTVLVHDVCTADATTITTSAATTDFVVYRITTSHPEHIRTCLLYHKTCQRDVAI